mgnify:CR=1 FL=1
MSLNFKEDHCIGAGQEVEVEADPREIDQEEVEVKIDQEEVEVEAEVEGDQGIEAKTQLIKIHVLEIKAEV